MASREGPGAAGAPVYVVDSNPNTRIHLTEALAGHFAVQGYGEERQAIEAVREQRPMVLILDGNVVPNGGLQVLKAIKQLSGIDNTVLIATEEDKRELFLMNAERLGVDATIRRPVAAEKLEQVVTQAVTRRVEGRWEKLPAPLPSALKETRDTFAEAWRHAAQGHGMPFDGPLAAGEYITNAVNNGQAAPFLNAMNGHPDLEFVHGLRSGVFLALFGQALGVGQTEQITLAAGGLLLDVGKAAVEENVLEKRGELGKHDWHKMRKHVHATVAFLRRCQGVKKGVISVAEQHHERLDGSGYPWGLEGEEVNQVGRMAGIVDTFAAMTERRLHRNAFSPAEAFDAMKELSGKLDSRMLAAFEMTVSRTLPSG